MAGDDPAKVAAALDEVQRVNAARARFFKETFRLSNDDPLQYDLIINTDRFAGLDAVADLVVRAFRAHGARA